MCNKNIFNIQRLLLNPFYALTAWAHLSQKKSKIQKYDFHLSLTYCDIMDSDVLLSLQLLLSMPLCLCQLLPQCYQSNLSFANLFFFPSTNANINNISRVVLPHTVPKNSSLKKSVLPEHYSAWFLQSPLGLFSEQSMRFLEFFSSTAFQMHRLT